MSINYVSNSDNRTQNNLYALSAGTLAGTTGAFIGYQISPRAAKNLEELTNLKEDLFIKTLDNMRQTPVYLNAMNSFGMARITQESAEESIKNIFPNEKVSVKDYKKIFNEFSQDTEKSTKIYKQFIQELINNKDKEISIEILLNKFKDKDKNLAEILNNIISNIPEIDDIKIEKIPLSDNLIKIFNESFENFKNIQDLKLNMYKNFGKLQKDGFIYQKDMIASVKEDIKPIVKKFMSLGDFETFKRFIPRPNGIKWAAIAGGCATLITAAYVKLFKKED